VDRTSQVGEVSQRRWIVSPVPVLEIGLLNGWILMIWLVIAFFLVPLNIIPKGREEDSDFTAEFSKTQRCAIRSMHIIYLLSVVYSIFVPLRLGTAWSHAGLPIYLVGLVSYAMVWVAFATTPPDKLITRGIYRYSRNPMQLSQVVIYLGVGIATASWIFLLLATIFMVVPILWVDAEERHCLSYYGDSYREYMKRTPRWIGISKS
jgi:protein-S-isoprenylcysteine O-methyltransferase Ste14